MALVHCLEKILDSRIFVERHSSGGRQAIKLKDSASGMMVSVTGKSEPVLVIRTEGRNAAKHFSCLKPGYNKVCDYLIIFQSGSNYYAIFIEMKKTMRGMDGYEQLRRSLPILDYLVSACEIECEIKPKISTKYILIAEKMNPRLDKQPIKPVKESDERYELITIKKFIGRTDFPINVLVG